MRGDPPVASTRASSNCACRSIREFACFSTSVSSVTSCAVYVATNSRALVVIPSPAPFEKPNIVSALARAMNRAGEVDVAARCAP